MLAAVVFEQYNHFIFFVVSALTVLESFAGSILSGPYIPLRRKVIERITVHFAFKRMFFPSENYGNNINKVGSEFVRNVRSAVFHLPCYFEKC
jgi:hypothetical protein